MKKRTAMREIERTLFLGFLHQSVGNYSTALRTYTTAYEGIAGTDPLDTEKRNENIVRCLMGMTECSLRLGDLKESERLLASVYKITTKTDEYPRDGRIHEFHTTRLRLGKLSMVSHILLAEVYMLHAKLLLAKNNPVSAHDGLYTAYEMILNTAPGRFQTPHQILVEIIDLRVKVLRVLRKGRKVVKYWLNIQKNQLRASSEKESKNPKGSNPVRILNWRIEYLRNKLKVDKYLFVFLLPYITLLVFLRRLLVRQLLQEFSLK